MKTRTTIVLMVLALTVAVVLGSATLGLGAPTDPRDVTKVPHYFGPYSNWANSPQVLANAIVAITPAAGDTTGTGAQATATVDSKTGAISAVAITSPGSGYTAAPDVAITAAGVTPTITATATAAISLGVVNSIAVVESGFGFTTPAVTLTGGNPTTPAAATASGGVDNVTVNTGGVYNVQPLVVFSQPNLAGGVQATGTATMVSGVVTAVDVVAPGSGYTSAPTVTIWDGAIGTLAPTPAAATATIGIGQIDVTTGGAGYDSAPTVDITDSGGTASVPASATASVAVKGAVTGITVNNPGAGYLTPGLKKFVDTLPGLGPTAANDLGQYIPVAVPDTTTYPGTDYYEIGVVQYRMKFHRDLPATLLRGYVQLSTSVVPGNRVPLSNANLDPALPDAPIASYTGVDNPHYLGPTIVASKNKPVRIVFRNLLPKGAGGNLFLPVDTSLMGSGMGPNMIKLDANGVPIDAAPDLGLVTDGVRNPECGESPKSPMCFSENRATLHLHGGITPWISDGTPHQWITPDGESTDYPKGVSVSNVPDMPDPGPGAQTFFYSNQQSARLMFYHDHAWGITRLNVYAGEAAGYVLTDAMEQALIAPGGALEGLGVGTPLVIQDKTFVPKNIAATDPTWDATRWGGEGSLWTPHVYMPAQNPGDPSGMSAFGRWMYGPWFWPPAKDAKYPPIANPYYDATCDPNVILPDGSNQFCEPALIPSTPNLSVGMEAFNDTPLVNGTVYPTTTVDPKAYRYRILNAANDRFWNLSWYVADPRTGTLSEVALNPAEVLAAQTDPVVFPTPDTTNSPKGPSWVQIGTEGGFLPAPVVVPAQPTTWITDPTRFDVGNVDLHSLLLAPAERADVIVDFSQFRGKTLILYNDAPAAFPARVPGYDYYTGGPDLSPAGAPTTLPGFGPNTRTIMQVKVSNAAPATAWDRPNTTADRMGALVTAWGHKADGSGVFEKSVDPIIVGQAAYNSAYGTSFVTNGWCNAPGIDPASPAWTKCDGYARIMEGSQPTDLFGFNTLAAPSAKMQIPFQPKGIHDEMNSASFDEWGRMTANMGLEAPGATPLLQNIILYPYVNPVTEILDSTLLPSSLDVTPISSAADGTQIWKITHNGVDTHPIHFHLYDVQVINRVTWDNIIIAPEPTELGWKDTVRVSPLEDTIVAVRPIVPTIPFGVPDSKRPYNPMMPIGAKGAVNGPLGTQAGFNNTDTKGNPIAPIVNKVDSFDWEYVFHCHILSHEEMDMMRPVTVKVANATPDAPNPVSFTRGSVILNWTDPTPVDYLVPTTWANPKNEIGFRIERAPADALGNATGAYATIATAPANTTTYTDATADPLIRYVYHVIAFNQAGEAISDVLFVDVVAPAAPTFLTGILSAGGGGPDGLQVALSWTDNANSETGFVVERSIAGLGTWSQIGTVNAPVAGTGGTGTYTDTTVAPGTSYDYRVAATNPAGTSPYSNTFTIAIPAVPAAPSAFTAAAQVGPQVALGWTDNANNETGFTLQVSTDGGATWSALATPAIDATAYTHTPVVLGSTYDYRLRADNGVVASAWVTATVTVPGVPAAPTGLTATQLAGLQGSLTWTDNATNENSYIVERSDNGGPFAILPGASALPANTAAHTDAGLVPGHTYDYRVAAVNTISGPSAYSNTATLAVPSLPAAPSLVGAVQQPGLVIAVTWTDNANNETGFTVQRSVNGGLFGTVAVLGANAVGFADTVVTPGNTYAYQVRAFNLSGFSAWAASPTVAVPTIPAAPSGLARTVTRTAAGPDSVALRWTDNANNEDGFTLQRATDAAFATGLVTFPLGANTTTFTTPVTHGATYYYRIQAYNLSGLSAWSNTSNVTTVPLTPTNFRSTGRTTSSIALAWNNNSLNESGFLIQRRTGGGAWTSLSNAPANSTTRNVTGLARNRTYQFRIRAFNGVGNSPWSPTLQVSTLP